MNRSVFSIILLALIANLCAAEIVIQTSEPKHLVGLYDAAVDILMTCYGDPGSAVGIVGDPDGSILKTLRLKYFIPVVLLHHKGSPVYDQGLNVHRLKVFVIAAPSPQEAFFSVETLRFTKWWNQYASFLFVDMRPNSNRQCSGFKAYAFIPIYFGVLNAQFICSNGSSGELIFNSNQFARQAPPVWKFLMGIKLPGIKNRLSLYNRPYEKGGVSCEALNFPKTINVGGWPVRFTTRMKRSVFEVDDPSYKKFLSGLPDDGRKFFDAFIRSKLWFINNIVKPLNATAVIDNKESDSVDDSQALALGIQLLPNYLSFSTSTARKFTRYMIFPLNDEPLFAVTKYTAHMTQLDKILSVIDGNCRIGMWVVYLISFLFFKLILRQAVMPALLNLVRLTCNTGLPNEPRNLAPRLYLASLFMFVITLQGIYTGNLASLLTTTIAYKNVETKQDIPKLGYTVYTKKDSNAKLAADPMLVGHVIEIPPSEKCVDYVLREPLAVCVQGIFQTVNTAMRLKLHVSRDPIVHEYPYHPITAYNPLARRIESIMRRWNEHGLRHTDPIFDKLRLKLIDDDEVNNNTERRVMTLYDLSFAFVILGIGLLCSSICFIGEIVIYTIRLKIAKRRNRVRALGVKKNSFLSFPSLNFRFNARRSLSKRP